MWSERKPRAFHIQARQRFLKIYKIGSACLRSSSILIRLLIVTMRYLQREAMLALFINL